MTTSYYSEAFYKLEGEYTVLNRQLAASEERVKTLEKIMKGADAADENRERKLRQQEKRVRVLSEALEGIAEGDCSWAITGYHCPVKQDDGKQYPFCPSCSARQALGDSQDD